MASTILKSKNAVVANGFAEKYNNVTTHVAGLAARRMNKISRRSIYPKVIPITVYQIFLFDIFLKRNRIVQSISPLS